MILLPPTLEMHLNVVPKAPSLTVNGVSWTAPLATLASSLMANVSRIPFAPSVSGTASSVFRQRAVSVPMA